MTYFRKHVFTLLVFLPLVSIAQNDLTVGIHGGPTSSTIRGFETSRDLSARISFLVGMSLEYQWSESSSLVSGVSYERKSFNDDTPLAFEDGFRKVERDFEYNYLTIPLLYRFKIGNEKTKFFINAGVYIGFFQNGTVSDFEVTFDLNEDDFEKTEFGAAAGIGVIHKISDLFNISLELRNNLGLTNISTIPVDFEDGEVLTNTINAILGFSVNL